MQGFLMYAKLTPTLLSVILGASSAMSAWSATADERDQHAIATAKLMMAGMRHPADRQLKEYKEAGYPSNDPHLDKALRFTYLDRFADELPEKDKDKNAAELKALRAELDPAQKANKLSPIAKLIYSGGGGSASRLVNEIAKFLMHPDGAPPLAKPGADKVQMLARMLESLGKQAEEDFKAAVDKILANKPVEDKIWDLADTSKEYHEKVNHALDLRMEALKPLHDAMIALRDAAQRGADFGIDPAPVKAQLKKMFTESRKELDKKTWTEVISQWDFEWGEFNPYIHFYCGPLLADAFLAGGKVREEEVEGVLQAIIDFNVKDFREANLRAEAYRLKYAGWQALLHFRLAQNTPQSFTRGANAWSDLLERAKTDDYMRLSSVPSRIAGDLAKVHMTAARLFFAKGDLNMANSLMAEVAGAKISSAVPQYAKQWIAYWGSGDNRGGNAWAQRPMAEDPDKAMLIARAFISEGLSTADPLQARRNYLSAAVALRNGTLGLSAATLEEKKYIEFAPQVYQLYANVLYRLDMRYHAVIVSQEGARTLSNKIKSYTDNKKPNPWQKKDKDGKMVWDESRITPFRVANDSMVYANQLVFRNRNAQSLLNDSIELLRGIDPQAVGENLDKQQLLAELQEGNFEGAIRGAKTFATKYPGSFLWAFGFMSSARTSWMDKMVKDDNKSGIAQLSKEIEEDNKIAAVKLSEELAKKDITPERRKELERTRSTIKVSEVENLLANKKYVEVIKLLDADFMKNLPSDETLAARMMRQLARATNEWHEDRKDELAKDPAALLEALKTYQTVYKNLEKGTSKLRNKNVDTTLDNAAKLLALVFNRSVTMIVNLQAAGKADADLIEMAGVAQRAFADLFEPTITDATKPSNILFVASTLWDVEETERAGKQYKRYLMLTEKDEAFNNFNANPKVLLDKLTPIVTARGEFKKAWDEIVDLTYDSPEDKDAYVNLPQANWPARARKDTLSALGKVKEFRTLMAKNKAVVAPAQYKQIEEAVDQLNNMLNAAANKTMAKSRLAAYYREIGQFDLALPHLMDLFNEDPLNVDNQMALVLVTYNAALKADPMPPKAELEKARNIAANIRTEKRGTRDKLGYWEAYTLVLEFSVMLGENKVVNDSLSFLRRDRSDLSRDLIMPPEYGDDKRVRRPQNVLATQLARRFLSIYEKNGVTEKPAYKIAEIDNNGETLTIFTEPDAPVFVTKTMMTPDEDEVTAIVAADGSTPAPQAPTAPVADPAPAAETKPEAKSETKPETTTKDDAAKKETP
jgi:hypothetical protein